MEIAIQSILLLFFVAYPGLIFRRFYFQGEFSKQFDSKGWPQSLALSIIFGLGIHLFLTTIFYFANTLVDSDNLQKLVSLYKNFEPPFYVSGIKYNILIWYLTLLFFAPILLGILSYFIIRVTKCDLNFPIFRFNNHWHYYFKGEIQNYKDFKIKNSITGKSKPKLTMIDVLCNNGINDTLFYSGVLSQYTISRVTGDLQYLYITIPSKTKRVADQLVSKDIPGDCLILKNSNIINMNLRYIYGDDDSKINNTKIAAIILYVLYFLNLVEPFSIIAFGFKASVILKILLHVTIWSLVNTISIFFLERKKVSGWIGFGFISALFLLTLFITIKALNK